MEYAAQPAAIAGTQTFLTRVFAWMVVGLLVTAASAAVIGSSDSMLADVTSNPILLIVLFVGQLGLVDRHLRRREPHVHRARPARCSWSTRR